MKVFRPTEERCKKSRYYSINASNLCPPMYSKDSDLKIGSVVIDCLNFEKLFVFWREALRYVARGPAEDGWVILRDPGEETSMFR